MALASSRSVTFNSSNLISIHSNYNTNMLSSCSRITIIPVKQNNVTGHRSRVLRDQLTFPTKCFKHLSTTSRIATTAKKFLCNIFFSICCHLKDPANEHSTPSQTILTRPSITSIFTIAIILPSSKSIGCFTIEITITLLSKVTNLI